jgi:hypothetical protein
VLLASVGSSLAAPSPASLIAVLSPPQPLPDSAHLTTQRMPQPYREAPRYWRDPNWQCEAPWYWRDPHWRWDWVKNCYVYKRLRCERPRNRGRGAAMSHVYENDGAPIGSAIEFLSDWPW